MLMKVGEECCVVFVEAKAKDDEPVGGPKDGSGRFPFPEKFRWCPLVRSWGDDEGVAGQASSAVRVTPVPVPRNGPVDLCERSSPSEPDRVTPLGNRIRASSCERLAWETVVEVLCTERVLNEQVVVGGQDPSKRVLEEAANELPDGPYAGSIVCSVLINHQNMPTPSEGVVLVPDVWLGKTADDVPENRATRGDTSLHRIGYEGFRGLVGMKVVPRLLRLADLFEPIQFPWPEWNYLEVEELSCQRKTRGPVRESGTGEER